MKKIYQRGLLAVLLAGTALTVSCSRETDYYVPNQESTEYQSGWQKRFGEVDAQQTWNTATQVEADIQLAAGTTVRIYTANPANANSRLQAVVNANGQTTVKFDAEHSQKTAYVRAVSEGRTVLQGYYDITDGKLSIGEETAGARRFSAGVTTTVGRVVDVAPFQHPDEGQYGWGMRESGKMYYLTNVVRTPVRGWTLNDLLPIVGKDGAFTEYANNREIYKDEFGTSVVYTMKTSGPVTVTNMFGGTQFYNQFGYFYYYGNSLQDMLNAKKYVVMDDARPRSNIKCGTEDITGMTLPANIAGVEAEYPYHDGTHVVTGTEYQLVYFDEQGNASFDFPAGIHIAFFLRTLTNWEEPDAATIAQKEQEAGNTVFSIPELNSYYNKYYDSNDRSKGGDYEAVTYKYGHTTIIGFEDGYDKDMNDIMWSVEGNFEETVPNVIDNYEEPQAMSWIIACEDLGSKDDYDFNDIVVAVSHATGSTTAYVTPMAAGGIYPAYIFLGSANLGEIHNLIQPSIKPDANGQYTMLNTRAGKGTPGEAVAVSVAADFSLAYDGENRQNMGGFSICVITPDDRNGSKAVTIGAPAVGSVPQMLLVPATWLWPIERRQIEVAYPNFANWSQNAGQHTNWYDTCVDSEVVK